MTIPNVIIVVARCATRESEIFGVRVEEMQSREWDATWSFAMPSAVAAREGYDREEASGHIQLGGGYPGCPSCGNASFAKCGSCQRIGCWDGSKTYYQCPWCANGGELSGAITQMSGGGDRR